MCPVPLIFEPFVVASILARGRITVVLLGLLYRLIFSTATLICGTIESNLPLITPFSVIFPDLMLFSLSAWSWPIASKAPFRGILFAKTFIFAYAFVSIAPVSDNGAPLKLAEALEILILLEEKSISAWIFFSATLYKL